MTTDYHYFNPKPSAPEESWRTVEVRCRECGNLKEKDVRLKLDTQVSEIENGTPAFCSNCGEDTIHDYTAGE